MFDANAMARRAFLQGAGSLLSAQWLAQPARAAQAPELVGIEGWINSPPLTMHGLRGRPVLVNFLRPLLHQLHSCHAVSEKLV